jgi:RNA polymerase sigma-70 factor (ECF subfamily)
MAEALLPSESSDGDVPPFERLLEHAAWLRSLARHLVDDAAAAEDLVQETWLAAIRRPPVLTRPMQPWLAGVARRLAAFARRSEGRRRRRESEPRAPTGAPSTHELVARAELQRRLVERVLVLREPSRSTVLLCYFEGLAPSEAARALGVPAATMRSRLKRALDELRAQFDAEQREGGVDWRGAFAVFAARAGGGATAMVAKAAAVFMVASAAFVAWKSLEHAPREDAAPVRVATAASEEPTRAVTQEAATTPARVLETPVAETPANDVKFLKLKDGEFEEWESQPYPVIRGQLLLPDGSLAGHCTIDYRYMPASVRDGMSVGSSASESGAFVLPLPNAIVSSAKSVRVFARAFVDGRPLSRIVEVPLVPQEDLEIRLADAPQLRVRVVDEERAPVETYRCLAVDTWDMGGGTEWRDADLVRSLTKPQYLDLQGGKIEPHPEGRCDLDLPRDRYIVVVDAPGFARGVAGPFAVEPPLDPASRDVEVVLTREIPIAGRVLAEGRPVEGALVALNALPPPGCHFVMDGLVLTVNPWNGQRVTTHADGSFALPQVAAPNGVRLTVLAKGYARNEITIAANRIDRSADLEVVMRPGGTLTGTVTGIQPGVSADWLRDNGPVVIAERRDLWPRAARVDADGKFRIEHLSPGPWHVFLPSNGRQLEGADLGHGGSGGRKNEPEPPTEWNVEIREGDVSSITLDLSGRVTSR